MIKDVEEISDDFKWEMSRKEFIRSLLIVGTVSQIPFLSGCETENEIREIECSPLSKKQLKVLQALQLVLFPKEGDGPSALDINADKWVVYVLNDEREPQRERDFIVEHLDGLNTFSEKTYSKAFDKLDKENQEILLNQFFEETKQKRWGSRMITLLFEALLLDPIYGVNPDNIGWKWLQHNPGVPRPNEMNKYPTIYTTIDDV